MANKKGFTVLMTFKAIAKTSFGSMKKAYKSLSDGVKTYVSQMKAAQTKTEKFKITLGALKSIGKTVFNGLKSIASFIAQKLCAALQSALNLIIRMATEGQALAKVQQQVEAQVAAIYGSSNLDKYKTLTSNIQAAGVIGDEKLLTGIQFLGNYGVSAADSGNLISRLADVAASKWGVDTTEANMETLGTAFGKSIQTGTTRSLRMYGLDVDSEAFANASKSERVQMISDAIDNSSMAGRNAALLKTSEGRSQNVENAIGDLQEKMGNILNKLKVRFLTKVIEPLLPTFNYLVDTIGPEILRAVDVLAKFLTTHKERIVNVILKATHSFVKHIPDIMDAVIGIFNWLQENLFPTEEQEQQQRQKDVGIVEGVKDLTGGYGATGNIVRGVGTVALAINSLFAIRKFIFGALKKAGKFLVAVASNQIWDWLRLDQHSGILQRFFVDKVSGGRWIKAGNEILDMTTDQTKHWEVEHGTVFRELKTKIKTSKLGKAVSSVVSKLTDRGGFIRTIDTSTGWFAKIGEALKTIWKPLSKALKPILKILRFFSMDIIGDALLVGEGVEWLNNKFQINQKSSGWFNKYVGSNLASLGIGSMNNGVWTIGSSNRGYALGTPYASKGLATINERGGEIMMTPSGTAIIPADKSSTILSGRNNIEVNLTVQGNVIGNKEYADQLANTIVNRLELAMVSA